MKLKFWYLLDNAAPNASLYPTCFVDLQADSYHALTSTSVKPLLSIQVKQLIKKYSCTHVNIKNKNSMIQSTIPRAPGQQPRLEIALNNKALFDKTKLKLMGCSCYLCKNLSLVIPSTHSNKR